MKTIKQILREAINEEVYFDSYSGALTKARSYAESRGYEIDEDDWWREVTTGYPGRPKEDETTRITVGLIKNGKPQRKALHIQVYNMGIKFKRNYELNCYIN